MTEANRQHQWSWSTSPEFDQNEKGHRLGDPFLRFLPAEMVFSLTPLTAMAGRNLSPPLSFSKHLAVVSQQHRPPRSRSIHRFNLLPVVWFGCVSAFLGVGGAWILIISHGTLPDALEICAT